MNDRFDTYSSPFRNPKRKEAGRPERPRFDRQWHSAPFGRLRELLSGGYRPTLALEPSDEPDGRSPDSDDTDDSADASGDAERNNRGGPDRDKEIRQDSIDGERLAELLVEASILTEDEAADDLRLTESFRTVWHRRIGQLHDSERALLRTASILEVDPGDLRLEGGETFTASLRGAEIGAWNSKAAFLADLALRPTLEEWLPLWEQLDDNSRGMLLARLRAFLESCPICDGDVAPNDGVESGVSLECVACGQVVFASR